MRNLTVPSFTDEELAARVLVWEHKLYPAVLRRYASDDRTRVLLP